MTLTWKNCNLPNKMIWLQITITTKYQRINTQLMKIKTNKYTHRLKSDSHVSENFCQIKIFPSLVQKNTIIYDIYEIYKSLNLELLILVLAVWY